MTFQEALNLKNMSYGNFICKNNNYYNVYVSPKLGTDLQDFISDYNENEYNDETAKKYSSNNEYGVAYIMDNESRRKNNLKY